MRLPATAVLDGWPPARVRAGAQNPAYRPARPSPWLRTAADQLDEACLAMIGGDVLLGKRRARRESPQPPPLDETQALAWYRATFDDDGTNDGLALARMHAWAEGQSLGPFAHGVPLRSKNYGPVPF